MSTSPEINPRANTVFLFHGAYGHPDENWFPWLRSELTSLGCRVLTPQFPTPENQCLESWIATFRNQTIEFRTTDIVVAHSVGVAFLLHLLQRTSRSIRGVVLVSGFVGKLNIEKFDVLNDSITRGPFDWSAIRKNAGTILQFHSDNDPYVPIEKAFELHKELDSSLSIIPGGGHLNMSAGFQSFPLLLESLKLLLRPGHCSLGK